jgi:hypothetical protein
MDGYYALLNLSDSGWKEHATAHQVGLDHLDRIVE